MPIVIVKKNFRIWISSKFHWDELSNSVYYLINRYLAINSSYNSKVSSYNRKICWIA